MSIRDKSFLAIIVAIGVSLVLFTLFSSAPSIWSPRESGLSRATSWVSDWLGIPREAVAAIGDVSRVVLVALVLLAIVAVLVGPVRSDREERQASLDERGDR
ncbi:hypothetical protein [Streptomyces sp. MMS24-I29]|uniref:hypothetical protein n=1 Tax=Streptomyces sp. MMS24-I29 TaxID=3351480 RepID=UPI003C7AF4C7